jgi:hypothetical protein
LNRADWRCLLFLILMTTGVLIVGLSYVHDLSTTEVFPFVMAWVAASLFYLLANFVGDDYQVLTQDFRSGDVAILDYDEEERGSGMREGRGGDGS